MRALAETYFGKELGDFLDSTDLLIRMDGRDLESGLHRGVRRNKFVSDSLRRMDSVNNRMIPETVLTLPTNVRKSLTAQNLRRDSLRKKIMHRDSLIARARASGDSLMNGIRELEARVYGYMAQHIRDGEVGYSQEGAKLDPEDRPLLRAFGIYPFHFSSLFWTVSMVAVAAIAAFRLAILTGRNPWAWSVAAALFAPAVLLFLIIAPPRSVGTSGADSTAPPIQS
jgi:hypothetical protein